VVRKSEMAENWKMTSDNEEEWKDYSISENTEFPKAFCAILHRIDMVNQLEVWVTSPF
jgi:hypothetical protein